MRYTFKDDPEIGSYRQRQGFLFLPKMIDNEIRWLEYAYWTEQYQSGSMEDGPRWEAICWKND